MALTDETMETIKTALESSLSESYIEAVLKRLDSFGYTVADSDAWVIGFAMQKVENHIKNDCNVDEIPDGLFETAVDMACGEFFFSKKNSGQLELSGIDLIGAISSIKEGDTQVNFNGSSDEARLDSLISYLMTNGEEDFACYRTLRW